MQNLLQNEFNQVLEIRGQSPDEVERIAKIKRIKNYEEIKKKELIISLLKSKQSIAEMFNNNNNNNNDNDNNNNNNNNNNLYDNKTNDIRRILSRLKDILSKINRKKIKDKLYKIKHQRNLSEAEN